MYRMAAAFLWRKEITYPDTNEIPPVSGGIFLLTKESSLVNGAPTNNANDILRSSECSFYAGSDQSSSSSSSMSESSVPGLAFTQGLPSSEALKLYTGFMTSMMSTDSFITSMMSSRDL